MSGVRDSAFDNDKDNFTNEFAASLVGDAESSARTKRFQSEFVQKKARVRVVKERIVSREKFIIVVVVIFSMFEPFTDCREARSYHEEKYIRK
ncbi:unnamed protein product, partial [Iphiclides podalirius]